MAKIPISSEEQNPEESAAEKHVEQIMGPAQPLDGAKPDLATSASSNDSSDSSDGVQSSPPTPGAGSPAPSAPEVSPELDLEQSGSEETIAEAAEIANSKLEQQLDRQNDIPVEDDLDMSQLPEDFAESSADEDPKTDAAVDDILHTDADTALPGSRHAEAVVMKPSLFERVKNTWFAWWDNPKKRYSTLAVVAVLIIAIAFVAPVRDMVLNIFGVRSSVTASVLDSTTNLPLQNAILTVDGSSAKSNADGVVTLRGIRLGTHDVEIKKLAFATHTKKVRFGMRIVDLGEVTLKATGSQISYQFTDFLSGKPVADVSLASGEATAKSDKNGKAIITIPPTDARNSKITINKNGYRTETLDTPTDITVVTRQKLVPSARAVYVSKASGKYDVYKVYIDGKDRQVLLPGTGLETQNIVALPNPDGKRVAVASTRDDKRNNDGYLLTAVNIVDTESGDSINIDYAEQVQFLGWRGSSFIYSETAAGASAANASRQRIIAYDVASNKRLQLANANYFAGQELIGNMLYYTVSATDPTVTETFTRVGVDGTNRKTLYIGNVWSLLRVDYTKLKLQTPDKWYEYIVGSSAPVASTPVSEYASRYYVDAPDIKSSAWVDVRDNRGLLMLHEVASGKDTTLTTQKDMQLPSYWLNNSVIVYRVNGANEVADYAVSVDGGAPVKIADVSLTGVR